MQLLLLLRGVMLGGRAASAARLVTAARRPSRKRRLRHGKLYHSSASQLRVAPLPGLRCSEPLLNSGARWRVWWRVCGRAVVMAAKRLRLRRTARGCRPLSCCVRKGGVCGGSAVER